MLLKKLSDYHKIWLGILMIKLTFTLKLILTLSKIKISEIIHTGEFYGKVPRSLIKTSLPIMKNVVAALTKTFLTSLRLTTVESAANLGIYKTFLFQEQQYQ